MEPIASTSAAKFRFTPLKASRHAAYTSSDPTETVELMDVDALANVGDLPPTSPSAYLPHLASKIDHYEALETVDLKSNKCHVPVSHTNPLFDAFVIDSTTEPQKIIIYILQMLTAKKREGSKAGYSMIKKMRVKANRLWHAATVEMRYVLVVPSKPTRVCEWHLSAGWWDPTVQGNVYCLVIPVCGFSQLLILFADATPVLEP